MDFKIVWAGRKLFHTIGQGVVAMGLMMLAWTHYQGRQKSRSYYLDYHSLMNS